jgi:hypothetical protein
MHTRKSESTVYPQIDMTSEVVLEPTNVKTEMRDDIEMYVYDENVYTKEEYMLVQIQKNIASTDYIAMMTGVM